MRNHGLIYEPKLRAELFASTLEEQFTCPTTISKSGDVVGNTILSLENMIYNIAVISPGELKFILKRLLCEKAIGLDGISNKALKHFSERTIQDLNKSLNTYLRLNYFQSKGESQP